MDYTDCTLCPRQCGVNRTAGERGFCRCPDTALVAKTMLHKWEEPVLAGSGGSGAVFFGGCTLGCRFCQNRAISAGPTGVTGHDGSMTTAHANSARDALSRLETMVLMSGMELPLRAIRSQISSAVDIIVQIARLRDGSRKIINIAEVTGMEGDIITLQDLFFFENHGLDKDGRITGAFVSSGLRPQCTEKLAMNGVNLSLDLFMT